MNIIIGRVTKDLEPKTSQSGVNYVSFDVAENIGFGEKAKTLSLTKQIVKKAWRLPHYLYQL